MNKDCSSDDNIDRTILDTWFKANCKGKEGCIMNFPHDQLAQPAASRFLKADIGA
jgi:hypothetical protein